jgi:hypothetical protein
MAQYVDGTGTERALTVADMLHPDFQEAYSDLYKGLNGFRPRGHDTATMLRFFDTYEENFAEHQAEEDIRQAARLKYLEEKHSRTFETYYEAQRFNEDAAWTRHQEQMAREEEEAEAIADHKAELNRRFSPLAAIEAWEHGSL